MLRQLRDELRAGRAARAAARSGAPAAVWPWRAALASLACLALTALVVL